MSNWKYCKNKWWISWFNFKNVPEDDYIKKFNRTYQDMKSYGIGWEYFRYIFKLKFDEIGLEVVHEWDSSHIIWFTKKYAYWFIWRDSSNCNKRGRLKFRCFKDINDGTECG